MCFTSRLESVIHIFEEFDYKLYIELDNIIAVKLGQRNFSLLVNNKLQENEELRNILISSIEKRIYEKIYKIFPHEYFLMSFPTYYEYELSLFDLIVFESNYIKLCEKVYIGILVTQII